MWQWITRGLVWPDTELGTSRSSYNFILSLFLTFSLRLSFFIAEELAPKGGPLMTTNTDVFHRSGVLNSNDHTVAAIQFGKGAADHQLESHGAQLENQYGQRSHRGIWFIAGISRTSSGQAGTLQVGLNPSCIPVQTHGLFSSRYFQAAVSALAMASKADHRMCCMWHCNGCQGQTVHAMEEWVLLCGDPESCRSVLLWRSVVVLWTDLQVPTRALQAPTAFSHVFVHPQLTSQLTTLGRRSDAFAEGFLQAKRKIKLFFFFFNRRWKCVF